jgi:hypothetical protein
MRVVDVIVGRYEGLGVWYDSAGKTMGYRVAQTVGVVSDGFDLEFAHDFADGTTVRATFHMTWLTPYLFRVINRGTAVGHGYCVANACKYHIEAAENFVEVSYHPSAERLEVYGSSSRNADGNYIAWHEELRRADSSNPDTDRR